MRGVFLEYLDKLGWIYFDLLTLPNVLEHVGIPGGNFTLASHRVGFVYECMMHICVEEICKRLSRTKTLNGCVQIARVAHIVNTCQTCVSLDF